MTGIADFLTQYGYLAIFALLMFGIVGPLIPDETILVVSGIFIHKSQLHFVPAALAGIAGSICGITLSYAIGLYGFGWLERHWTGLSRFSKQHLARAEHWFRRFGRWTLFIGYFVAGVRHFTALFAGISRMPYRRFAGPAYAGAVLWVLTFLGLGYFAGESWSKVSGTVDRAILVCAAAVVMGGLIWVKLRKKAA